MSRELRFGDCRIATPIARLSVRIRDERPLLGGPLALRGLRCGDGLVAERALFDLDAQLAPGLDGWRGGALVRIASLRTGANRLAGLDGRVSFGGDAGETRGTADLAAAAAATPVLGARQIRFAGRYRAGAAPRPARPRRGIGGAGGDRHRRRRGGRGGGAARRSGNAGRAGGRRAGRCR